MGNGEKPEKENTKHSERVGSGLRTHSRQGGQKPCLSRGASPPWPLCSLPSPRGGTGSGRAMEPPESILLKLPLPHSSPCSIPEQVWPAQAAPALVSLETQCPGFTQILRHSHRLCQLSGVTIRHTRNNVLTEQKGCTYPLHPAFWGCPGISRPLQRHCSGW